MAVVRSGVYWGDPLLAERALERRAQAWAPARRVALFGDEHGVDRILAELAASDLFGERRVVVVRRADPFRDEGRLAQALEQGLPEDVALFFLGTDLQGRLAQAAQEAQGFPSPTGKELRSLAHRLLEEAEIPPSAFLVDLLVEACGGNTLRLAQEVHKLALWKGVRWTPQRVAQLLFFSEPVPYPLLDALGNGETAQALWEMKRLLRGGWAAGALFFMVVRHIRELLATLAAAEAGRPWPGPDWLIRRRLAQARRWGQARLVELLILAQELDVKTKTGRLSPETALLDLTLAWATP